MKTKKSLIAVFAVLAVLLTALLGAKPIYNLYRDLSFDWKERSPQEHTVKQYAETMGISYGEYPIRLIELLERNPETEGFVLNYPFHKDIEPDLSRYDRSAGVPLFLQWDPMWGYEDYGNDFLANTGCGPTCLAMVGYYLTGDENMTPDKIAKFAQRGGYYEKGHGSSWTLISEGGVELGLEVTELPLVEKKKDRPMGLQYRPMVSDEQGTVVAYEAIPWFVGVASDPEKNSLEELEGTLRRKNLTVDISFYFLYEAADAVLRIENCRVNLQAVVLRMLPDFFTSGTQLQRLLQLFKDQPIPKEKLILTVPSELIAKTTKTNIEIMERYTRNGMCLLADEYDPAQLPVEKLKSMGFTHVRPASRLYGTPELALAMTQLHQAGLTILGGNVESHETLAWLKDCHMAYCSGAITGLPVSEDEMIRDALAREK